MCAKPHLLAIVIAFLAAFALTTVPAAATTAGDCLTLPSPTCYTPQQFRTAYGVAPLLARGLDGRGETVVLPEFAPAAPGSGVTDIRADLARYDQLFGLPAARLQILGGTASPDLSFNEEAGDVEIVHAIAPQATIKVVLVPVDALRSAATTAGRYAAALRLAAAQGSVIASTAAWAESCFTAAEVATMHAALRAAQRKQVTVVVSSGDSGAAGGPCPGASAYAPAHGVDYPASDPLALAVGGTRLTASHATGAYLGETAWNLPIPSAPAWASTGGFSSLFPRPGYQAQSAGAGRGVPDVAADAAPDSGIAIAVTNGQNYLIGPGAGTSAAAPFWAGLIAIADQYAGHSLGFVNPAIYRIGVGAFHDITQGTNTVTFPDAKTVTGYPASPGWDPVTGRGSPNANVLVPDIAIGNRSTS